MTLNATCTSLISVCSDCAMVLANGTDGWGLDEAGRELGELHALNMSDSDITLGASADDCRHCGDAEMYGDCASWFSWSRCESCGSTLGGDRMHATLWWSEPPAVDGEARTVRVPAGTVHMSSGAVWAMLAEREGVEEITDGCAVTVASWWQVPRGPGEAFTRLVSHLPVTVEDLHDAIAYERAQTVGYGYAAEQGRVALGMLATWALNRHLQA